MAEECGLGEDPKAEIGAEKFETEFKVPYYKLFSCADASDRALMVMGTVSAVGNGICLPLTTVVFGQLLDSFGDSGESKNVLQNVSKRLLCWMVTGERQAARIRSLYLKTILGQDIGFFDKETNTGEIIGRMSRDTILIQAAMGEKVGQFIQSVATFGAGFVVALVKGWLLTLVMISSIPPLVLSGAIMTTIVAKMSAREQSAYSFASTVVMQTISSIRTVASFTGEKLAIAKYNASLDKAYESGVQEGLATGLGFGVIMFVVMCTYSLALWFGGKMVVEKGYSGGDVMNIIFSVLIGSMAMGQAAPCLSTFAVGQVAAHKMFEAIDRKPIIDSYDINGLILDQIRGNPWRYRTKGCLLQLPIKTRRSDLHRAVSLDNEWHELRFGRGC